MPPWHNDKLGTWDDPEDDAACADGFWSFDGTLFQFSSEDDHESSDQDDGVLYM